MSTVMAAIGIQQFHRRDELADKRRGLAKLYDQFLGELEMVVPIPHDYQEVVPFMYAVRIEGDCDVPSVRARLHTSGIPTGAQYQPNHVYTSFGGCKGPPLPVVSGLYPRLLVLPLHPDLSSEDVGYICERLADYKAQGDAALKAQKELKEIMKEEIPARASAAGRSAR